MQLHVSKNIFNKNKYNILFDLAPRQADKINTPILLLLFILPSIFLIPSSDVPSIHLLLSIDARTRLINLYMPLVINKTSTYT